MGFEPGHRPKKSNPKFELNMCVSKFKLRIGFVFLRRSEYDHKFKFCSIFTSTALDVILPINMLLITLSVPY